MSSSFALRRIEPPLKEAWRLTLPSESFIRCAPQQRENTVVVRCGHLVACLSISDGELVWRTMVAAEDVEEKVCVPAPEVFLTASRTRDGSELTALLWESGRHLWKAELPEGVMDEGVAVSEYRLFAFTVDADALAYHAHMLDLQTGEQLDTVPLPSGANHTLAIGEHLLFGSRTLAKDDAGLYSLELSSGQVRKIFDAPVGGLRTGKKTVVATVEGAQHGKYEVIAISLPDMEKLWAAPSSEFMLSVEGGYVAHLEPAESGKDRAVLREEMRGTSLWKSDDLEYEGLYVFCSGDAVCVMDELGITFLDRENGSTLARLDSPEWAFSRGAALAPGRMVIGHGNEVICYASEREGR